jgi:hypothetical protein
LPQLYQKVDINTTKIAAIAPEFSAETNRKLWHLYQNAALNSTNIDMIPPKSQIHIGQNLLYLQQKPFVKPNRNCNK